MYFYTCGYLAAAMQGICHELTGEPSTLSQIEDNTRDELSHGVYFPTMILARAWDVFVRGKKDSYQRSYNPVDEQEDFKRR